jgi:hypothetical protein
MAFNNELNPLSRKFTKMLGDRNIKCKMSLVLELVLQASSQPWYPLVTEHTNTKVNPLSHMHRNSVECCENEPEKEK